MEQFGERPEKEVHLWDYLNVILRRKWVALAFFVVVVVTVMVGTFAMRPVYRATCQVLIERESPKVVKMQEVLTLGARWGSDYYQTQYEILKNSVIAQRAIEELELEDHPEFKQKKRFAAALARGLKNLLIYSVVYSKNKKTHTPDKGTQLINAYLSRLRIEPIRDSRLVNISFETHDPKLAARMANTHAQLYIKHNWERKFNTSQDAVHWLDQQLKEVKKKLAASEEALQQYKRENNLVSIDFGETENIVNQKLIDLNNALTQAKTNRIEKENMYNELKRVSNNPGMIESMPAVVNNPLIQGLKAQYIKLKGEYSELSKKYGPKHPQMVRLKSQQAEIRSKIAHEAREIARGIETEYRIALAKEQSLFEELERQKHDTLNLDQKQIQYNVLKRDVAANRSLFDSLLQRIKETSLTEELSLTNISVANPARIPKSPTKPKKSQNLILALIIGLMGGVGIAFFFEYLDPSIKSSEEVEKQLGLTFLGHVEKMELQGRGSSGGDRGLIALHHPESSAVEAFRSIATNVLFSIPDKPKKVILITSAIAEEGKSTVATNLAIVMAQVGKKVLLIDADMRKPTVHSLFDVQREPGLSDLLAQDAQLSSLIRRPSVKDLQLVTAGTSPPNPSELLFSQRMADFIEAMRDEFDLTIIDSPPVMMLSDAPALAQGADGVIVVIKSGTTARPTIQKAVQQLLQVGAKLTGAVLNCHDIQGESYYYHSYYRDYYHRYYGKEDKGDREEVVEAPADL